MRGRQRLNKLERELDSLTASNLRYKAPVRLSAQQLAKEALEAAEMERCGGTYRKTVLMSEARVKR